MQSQAITNKVITTSYTFETENPVSTPTESSSPDPYPLLEKILLARTKINQIQYDRIWPGKSIIPSTSLIRVITDFKLNKEDIPVGERNQLLEYAMLTHNSELLQMACSNSKEENLIHSQHLLDSLNSAVKAVENNELSHEQLLNFLLATEKLTLNYCLKPEKRINNLVGFLLNYCHYPIYPPLIRLLFENGFDPFFKDFNGTSLCDRIISKWQNSSGELNVELLFKGESHCREILSQSEWLLRIANHPKASIEQKEFLTKLIEMSCQKKAVIELRSLLGSPTTSNHIKLYKLLESGASLDSLSTKWVTETIFQEHFNVNNSDCNNFEECLSLIYGIKKNNEEWINSSKIYLAFCIAKSKYTCYDNSQGNKFKQNFLEVIRGLNFSKEHWNTQDESGKTAYDYVQNCGLKELIEEIEGIVKK